MGARKRVTFAQVVDVLSSGRASERGFREKVLVRVHVDPACPRELGCAVRDSLVPEQPGCTVEVRGLLPGRDDGPAPDAAVVLLGSGDPSGLVSGYVLAGVPVALVAEGALDVPDLDLPEPVRPLACPLLASEARDLPDLLADWLLTSVEKPLALAAGFRVCRRRVAARLVRASAVENAAIGAFPLVPGSDLPLMLASQAKLALSLAAAHGRGLAPGRAAEVAAVAAAGLVYRAAARSLVRLAPGLAPLVRAGVGFAGTELTGRALALAHDLGDRPRTAAEPAGEPDGGAGEGALPRFQTADDGYVQIGGDPA